MDISTNHALERAVIAVCLLLHGGCIGQAREDIEATKTGLDKKIHAVAARSAVHLQEDALYCPRVFFYVKTEIILEILLLCWCC